MSSIGFKEWAIVCEAIARGDQSVVVRKGGIHEGRDGFRFQHEKFFLFPTLFHEQIAQTVLPADTAIPASPEGEVHIRTLVKVESARIVASLDAALNLSPFHILQPSVVADRFHYDEPTGVNVAIVRAFQLSAPWILPMEKRFGGCRSWVELPDPPDLGEPIPAISDEEHTRRVAEIRRILRDEG